MERRTKNKGGNIAKTHKGQQAKDGEFRGLLEGRGRGRGGACEPGKVHVLKHSVLPISVSKAH